jgi:hypothetical protein
MNETLDSERNEIGSAGKDPSNMPRQSNKKEITYSRKKKWTKPKKAVFLKTDGPNEKQVQEVYQIIKPVTQNREEHGENKPN